MNKTVADIRGLHDTPIEGGSEDEKLAMEDMKNLGMKYFVSLNPLEKMLEAATDNPGLTVIHRAFMENNLYDKNYLGKMTKKAIKYSSSEKPLIVPFNETNLLAETGDIFISPKEHIVKHFIPAARLILDKGGTPILTPVAQGNGSLDYFSSMIDALVDNDPDLLNEIKIGLHNYILDPEENIWEYPSLINKIVTSKLGKQIGIHITEGGMLQSLPRTFDDTTVAQVFIRILKEGIPKYLPIESESFWVYSNRAQRRFPSENEYQEELFNLNAWRISKNKEGVREVYSRVSELSKAA